MLIWVRLGKKNLIEVIEIISDNAEKRGLTPEIIEDLLNA